MLGTVLLGSEWASDAHQQIGIGAVLLGDCGNFGKSLKFSDLHLSDLQNGRNRNSFMELLGGLQIIYVKYPA